jgi:hypothetical protein
MSDTPQVLLAHHLKALRLPTFLREYDKLARQCAAEGVDHSRYLLRLAELEMIERERRTVERLIRASPQTSANLHDTTERGHIGGRDEKPYPSRTQSKRAIERGHCDSRCRFSGYEAFRSRSSRCS